MEEIKKGYYVRTKSGFVGKVIGRHGGYGLHYELDVAKEIQENFMNGIVHEDNIVKHSKNIIDLIECRDYVNLERVLDISEEYIKTTERIHNKNWLQSNIRTILTKEQFEQNCYKLYQNNKLYIEK